MTYVKGSIKEQTEGTFTVSMKEQKKYLMSHKSSRPEVFCLKGVLENFTKLTGKHLCQSLCYNKVVGPGLQLYQKRDCSTGVFLWILRNL